MINSTGGNLLAYKLCSLPLFFVLFFLFFLNVCVPFLPYGLFLDVATEKLFFHSKS